MLRLCLPLSFAVSLLSSSFAVAQPIGQPAAPPFAFPSNPAQWLNSSPISKEAMAGKGAVLYFFEEG